MQRDLVPSGLAYPAPLPVASDATGLSAVSQFLFVVFKWRRLILAIGLAFVVAATVVAVLKPTMHPATAKILFKSDRAGLQAAGLAAASARTPYSAEVVQSEVELFRTRAVLVSAARDLLGGEGAERTVSADAVERKLGSLGRDLIVTAMPGTNVIQATYSARSPQEAEHTLGLILKHYMEQHALAYRDSPGVLAFYEKEKDRAAAELKKAEDDLRSWQEANKTVAIEGEINAQLERWATLEKNLYQTEADIEAARARLGTLDGLASAQSPRAVMVREQVPNPLIAKLTQDLADAEVALAGQPRTPLIERLKADIAVAEATLKDAIATPLVSKLKSDLVTAEVALQDLRQRYTDLDRRVEEKKEQITLLRQELANAEREAQAAARERLGQLKVEVAAAEREAEFEARGRTRRIERELAAARAQGHIAGREAVGPNALREALERELATGRSQLMALISQRETLRQQARDAGASLGPLREKRLGVERLSRAVTVARETFLGHAKRLEDARITASLDKQQLSDVAIIEAPHGVADRDFMRRVLIVALACLVGVSLGVGTAFTIEFFNNSVRTREDVEFYVGLPVLATIPDLPGSAAHLMPPAARRLASVSTAEPD